MEPPLRRFFYVQRTHARERRHECLAPYCMMTPGSFDEATCRLVVGDERCRKIDAKARAAADAGEPCPPYSQPLGSTYWDAVRQEQEFQVGRHTYRKRIARIERMKANA